MNRRCLAATLIIVSLGLCQSCGRRAAGNLIRNGDLNEGSGKVPSVWQTASQRRFISSDTFSWDHQPENAGELRLINDKPNIADWTQTLRLRQGWYYLTGELKVTGDWSNMAMIGVHFQGREFGLRPHASPGGDSWTTGGLYFKLGGDQQNVQIVCQLEGGGSASFRHISLIPVAGAPPAGATQLDLASISDRPAESFGGADPRPFARPKGRPSSIVALVLALTGITLWGWIALAPPAPRGRDQS
jgi:hypothetical protein